MIGNDIVDLKQAEKDSNWKRPRFLDKVFTEEEQQLILNSDTPSQIVWLFWSMKEAAYKIYVQQFAKRFFNPKKLKCSLISFEKGTVIIENKSYFTTSEITEDFIYTVATLNKKTAFESSCFILENTNYKTQSDSLKNTFLDSFSNEKAFLKIKKNQLGVPQLFYKNEAVKQSFSLTHHGVYGAYAIST